MDVPRTHPLSTGPMKNPPPPSISKRLTANLRMTSGATKLSNDLAMVAGANAPTGHTGKPLKMITEVDGRKKRPSSLSRSISISICRFVESNIEEVLNLPDLSRVPKAFLTEIQQDQAYSTIYSELQKKLPHRVPSTSPPPVVVHPAEVEDLVDAAVEVVVEEPKDDDDDDESLVDDQSSTISSSVTLPPGSDGYDTDIEPGAGGKTAVERKSNRLV